MWCHNYILQHLSSFPCKSKIDEQEKKGWNTKYWDKNACPFASSSILYVIKAQTMLFRRFKQYLFLLRKKSGNDLIDSWKVRSIRLSYKFNINLRCPKVMRQNLFHTKKLIVAAQVKPHMYHWPLNMYNSDL